MCTKPAKRVEKIKGREPSMACGGMGAASRPAESPMAFIMLIVLIIPHLVFSALT
ncbi:MAG: hypothetical protein QME63_10200 [Actinomycetota bacterium]|nr:hypothetical protein [Actinomycetota bacterium]